MKTYVETELELLSRYAFRRGVWAYQNDLNECPFSDPVLTEPFWRGYRWAESKGKK
jgi:hypothetical protein